MLRLASNRVTGGSLASCGFLWLFARLSWLFPLSYYSLGFFFTFLPSEQLTNCSSRKRTTPGCSSPSYLERENTE